MSTLSPLLAAAERDSWFSAAGGQVGLVRITEDATNVISAYAVSGGLFSDVFQGLEKFHVDPPSPRRLFGSVLSARENSVFIIGGRDLLGGQPADFWQYDLLAENWAPLPISGPGSAPDIVLASTYRPSERAIYYVDTVNPHERPLHLRGHAAPVVRRLSGEEAEVARLVRVRLDDNSSELLGTWTRHKELDRISLVNTSDGSLLLVGSSSAKGKHWGALLDPSLPGCPRVVWSFAGNGALGAEPNLTRRGLTLPLVQGDTLANAFTPTHRLPGTVTHGIGECL